MNEQTNSIVLKSIVGVLALLILSSGSFAQNLKFESYKKDANVLYRALEKYHYAPRTVDDEFSAELFDRFIRSMDGRRVYFTKADIKELSIYRTKLDDELKGKSWSFLEKFSKLYKKRVEESDAFFTHILQNPISFKADDILLLPNKDSMDFVATDVDRVKRWERWIKFELLWLSHSHYVSKNPDSFAVATNIMKDTKKLQERVLKLERSTLAKTLSPRNGFEDNLLDVYFYTITTMYDPHTVYLSPSDWENFQSGISKEVLSFGLELKEGETGEIMVGNLVPGGSAWRSNEIHTGDVVVELKWEGKEPNDLTGMDLEEVNEIISESNTDKLEFTFRTAEGLVKKVVLMKTKINEEENIVKSFLLNGDKKIGYISLPGFYADWENGNGKGCANDVASEILKMKSENIDGLILDIRYNGGGSLQEGLDLAGIFIDEGPLYISQKREQKPLVVKDANRGTIYDGPMVVMINGQSASASELLASTLQDYNRSLIVGEKSFGKATGQRILPLDSNSLADNIDFNNVFSGGVLKVTIQKLYRVTGKSAQLKGVIPDVYIGQDRSDAFREESYKYALGSDTVPKRAMFTPLSPLPIMLLNEKSMKRQEAISNFTALKSLYASKPVSWSKSKEGIPLNSAKFKVKYMERYEWNKKISGLDDSDRILYTVKNHSYDTEVLKVDSYKNEINERVLMNLQKDIYIQESFQILIDLINLTK